MLALVLHMFVHSIYLVPQAMKVGCQFSITVHYFPSFTGNSIMCTIVQPQMCRLGSLRNIHARCYLRDIKWRFYVRKLQKHILYFPHNLYVNLAEGQWLSNKTYTFYAKILVHSSSIYKLWNLLASSDNTFELHETICYKVTSFVLWSFLWFVG